jgi:hypothetical protein
MDDWRRQWWPVCAAAVSVASFATAAYLACTRSAPEAAVAAVNGTMFAGITVSEICTRMRVRRLGSYFRHLNN